MLICIGCVSSPQYQRGKKSFFRWQTGEGYVLESTVGIASYYDKGFAGKPTASGEIFNPNAMTAAHKTYSFGTKVRVVNLKNNKTVVVRINDRGPFVKGRIIDLSRGAAEKIGMVNDGVTRVRIEVLEWGEEK
ncbi:MAG: septal ring lytic transglycosylase RlpA family protein [candidate division Zixibacteria bacterium]|nr:septal ring lytic transglycosylase RlpA family protein [Candidatus Tariuqbacter arcticus]